MARPVIGIDLGHGETAVFIRVGNRISALRLDAAGSLKMITAMAIIEGGGQQIVLMGNALRGYETLRKLTEADAQAVSGAEFRALLLEYTTVLQFEMVCEEERALYIPCEESELADDVREALHGALAAYEHDDVRFALKKGDYFSPLYQTFKAPPRTKENGFCAVAWDTVSNYDGVHKRTMGELMSLFLKTLSFRLIAHNKEEWMETEDGADIHIGVPALREWLAKDAIEQYAEMTAEAMAEWIRLPAEEAAEESKEPAKGLVIVQKKQSPLRRHVSIYSEPCAALMAYFHEYPESRLQSGCCVSDHGSGSLDFCCVAVRNGLLCRITGSTDKCGGRMIEDGMLRRLTDREGLSILRDLRPGEGSALRLHLRMLKEAYYAAPDEMGDLPQRLRIHLKDGSVRTVDFTVRELVADVVRPGSAWHDAVSSFAENMAAAMTNQGLSSESIFLTGGTANVTEAREIFTSAGMGVGRMSGNTSASVADGLCRMVTRAELEEFGRDALYALSQLQNDASGELVWQLHACLAAELPATVTAVVGRYLDKGKGTHLRHLSFEVEDALVKKQALKPALCAALADYARTREKQLEPIVQEMAQERFPGRLPETPQMELDYDTIAKDAGRQIVRQFVQHLNLYGLLGSVVDMLMALFGKKIKNPWLGKDQLERIRRNMGKPGVSYEVHKAITNTLNEGEVCENLDGLVLDAVIGYLTLTRFDAELQL